MTWACMSTSCRLVLQSVQLLWDRFEHEWHRRHLSHRGQYSIERMQSLDDYCNRSSLVRSWVIYFALPLPALGIVVLNHCIPLQDPSNGWKANYGFWIQTLIANLTICTGILVQAKEMVPALNMTARHIALIALPSAACFVCLYMSMASLWAFPVPFGIAIVSVPYFAIIGIFFRVIMGKERFLSNHDLIQQVRAQFESLAMQSLLVMVYPGLGAIYSLLPPTYQSFFPLTFMLVKTLMNNGIASVSSDIERLPGVSLMSVEVFSVLYIVKCMQKAGSLTSYMAILLFDVFESVMAFRDIRSQAKHLRELMQMGLGQTLPQRVLELCLEPGVLSSRTSSIQLRSLIHFTGTKNNEGLLAKLELIAQTPLSPDHVETRSRFLMEHTDERWTGRAEETEKNLSSFENENIAVTAKQTIAPGKTSVRVSPTTAIIITLKQDSQRRIGNTLSTRTLCTRLSRKVWPTINAKAGLTTQQSGDLRLMNIEKKQNAVELALKILFQVEFHVLAEYVECIIPLMYSLHMTILFHLPNVKYFSDMADMTITQLERTVLNIFVYASLEILSLMALHYAIKRELGFSPARVLAFVLENQFFEFLGRLVIWYLVILVYTLYHCGIDFTLRFEWLQRNGRISYLINVPSDLTKMRFKVKYCANLKTTDTQAPVSQAKTSFESKTPYLEHDVQQQTCHRPTSSLARIGAFFLHSLQAVVVSGS